MKFMRWPAVVFTILMGLMNVPIAIDPQNSGVTGPLAWLISLLGLLGIGAAVSLIVRAPWGRPAVIAIGAINVIAAVIALVNHMEGAPIGLVVSVLGLGFGLLATNPAPRPVTT